MGKYKIVNEMYFDGRTPDEVCEILSSARASRQRIRLFYGDAETGRDWNEEFMVCGYIGISMGQIKIPLLIHNSRSDGGSGVLDHCIVKIMRNGRVVYEHPKISQQKV